MPTNCEVVCRRYEAISLNSIAWAGSTVEPELFSFSSRSTMPMSSCSRQAHCWQRSYRRVAYRHSPVSTRCPSRVSLLFLLLLPFTGVVSSSIWIAVAAGVRDDLHVLRDAHDVGTSAVDLAGETRPLPALLVIRRSGHHRLVMDGRWFLRVAISRNSPHR